MYSAGTVILANIVNVNDDKVDVDDCKSQEVVSPAEPAYTCHSRIVLSTYSAGD